MRDKGITKQITEQIISKVIVYFRKAILEIIFKKQFIFETHRNLFFKKRKTLPKYKSGGNNFNEIEVRNG